MRTPPKEYQLVVDYCAFMVAIALARHVVNDANLRVQFTAEQLASELNILPYANGPNFNVNPLALKHGFQLFHAYLWKIGLSIIDSYHVDKFLVEFFDLRGKNRSAEVIFSSFRSLTFDSESTILSAVVEFRDGMLKALTNLPVKYALIP